MNEEQVKETGAAYAVTPEKPITTADSATRSTETFTDRALSLGLQIGAGPIPHSTETTLATEVEQATGNVTVAEMTAQELKALIQSAVKEVLQEILDDPDAGLELRPEFEARLSEAMDYVASGGRLLSLEELTGQLESAGGV